ncbi:MAG: hypothetical protein ACRDJN_21315 [Chloroflexota bacterium]
MNTMQDLHTAPRPPISLTTRRMIDAERRLAATARRLGSLRGAALFSGRYDPDEYDQAVLAYRQARMSAEALWTLAAAREAQLPSAA